MSGSSSPPPIAGSPSTRLFPAPGATARTPTRPHHDRAAQEILTSSIKGWNPLQLNKRTESPTKPINKSDSQSTTSSASSSGPRRTSSSFKHVKSNSLVSNSVFKSPVPPAENPQHLQSTKHLSFVDGKIPTSDSSHSLTHSVSSGSIGLGISAAQRRTPSSGTRKTSSSKPNTPSGTRRVSNGTERKVSGGALSALDHSPDNADTNSPDVRSSSARKPRQSMGFKGLAKGGLVTKSPFLQQDEERKSPEKLGSPIRLGGSPGRRALEGGSPIKSTPPRFSGSPARFSSPSVPAKGDVFTLPTTVNAVPAIKATAQVSSNPYRQSPLSATTTTHNEPKIESTKESSPPDLLPFPRTVESASPTNTPIRGLGHGRAVATPTPTPTKSSITQRRLRGPRLSGGLDSPGDRKQKTVTFRDGPVDVKEFDRESVTDDGSEARYGSDGEGEDDGMQIGGYVSRHHADGSGGGMMVLDESEDGHSNYYRGAAEESTTANFIDSLVEDGYFSPPTLDTPEMGALDVDATHSIQGKLDSMPRLDTPSLGGSISATPIQEDMPFPMPPAREEVDEYGIPYGRTHHAERAAAAHAAKAKSSAQAPQPALPREGASSGEPVLRSANAAEPSLRGAIAPQKDSTGPHAHQQGSFIDPFVSIQTATKVYTSSSSSSGTTQPQQREESGVPLGRTSHTERAKVARLMATQRLGLGMPRRPVIPNFMESGDDVSEDGSYQFEESDDDADYSAVQEDKVARIEEANGLSSPKPVSAAIISQRQVSDASDQLYNATSNRTSYIATSVLSPVGTPTSRRSLPKPPRPQQIDIPEPVSVRAPSPEYESDASQQPKRFNLALPFSLPSISHTSPLFTSSAFAASSSESQQSDLREKRPQTPPNALDSAPKIVSPTRIPDFDFESHQNQSFGDISAELSASQAFKMVEDALPPVAPRSIITSPVRGVSPPASRPSSGESQSASMGSSTGRIRQRISRDMIRQKLEVRKAQGEGKIGESTQTSNTSGGVGDLSMISVAEKALMSVEKELPSPPTEWMVIATNKQSSSPISDKERPKIKPREQSKSAQEVLQQAQREGTIHNPKSALDRLVSDFSTASIDDSGRSTGNPVKASFSSSTANPKMVSDQTPAAAKRVSSLRPTEQDGDKTPIQEAPPTPVKDRIPGRREPSMTKVESTSKPRRKRSLSASEARQRGQGGNRMSMTLDLIKLQDDRSIMNAIEDEMEHIASDRPYRIREQRQKIIARSDDKVNHNGAGDLDTGRAWRQLRRPSDINQYAEELRAMKAKKSVSSKFGTIFVKVLGIESLNVPMPTQPTAFCITLDNGIDYIRTNYSILKEGARVNQEFALVEHANFEFALGLEIRRDPHIIKMVHDNMHQGAAASAGDTASVSSVRGHGFKNLFSSPRKASKAPLRQVQTTEPAKVEDNICRYFGTGDSTIARTHIAFNPIAKECDARILEIRYPMFGLRKTQAMASILRKPAVEGLPPPPAPVPEKKLLAKITLQIFRLPPLPGLSHDQLPQSIDDCLRGMRHHTWHEQEHLEGTLTQRGGDCTVPRRRPFRLLGSTLIAANPVTKKEVFSVDLRQLKLAEDNNTADRAAREEDDGISPMPCSFRLVFKNDDDIVFSADSDSEKQKWLAAFTSLVVRGIPSNPLWAEVLASQQRQNRDASSGSSGSGRSKHSES